MTETLYFLSDSLRSQQPDSRCGFVSLGCEKMRLNSSTNVSAGKEETLMNKTLKRILSLLIFAFYLSFFSCKGSAKHYPVDFVNRNVVFSPAKKPNPLRLVVEISKDGRLRLNKIETGTIDDGTELSNKLIAIFNDRQKVGIDEREVVIDPQGKVNDEDLEKLIKNLADVKAEPIRVIKSDL